MDETQLSSPIKPTATSTTSIIVPQAPPVAPKTYDNWGVAYLIATGFVAVMVAFGAVLAVFEGISKILDKFRAKGKENLSPLDKRITDLETTARNFRTVDQLDKDGQRLEDRFTHMKNNLQQQINGITDRVRTNESDLNALKLQITRQEGKIDNCLEENRRVVKTVDRLETKIDEHFENFTKILLSNPNLK